MPPSASKVMCMHMTYTGIHTCIKEINLLKNEFYKKIKGEKWRQQKKKIKKYINWQEEKFFLKKDKVFLCNCDYPVTRSVEQGDLKFRALPASTRTKNIHHSTQLQGNLKLYKVGGSIHLQSQQVGGRDRRIQDQPGLQCKLQNS